ncbi:MAG TPA: hypothetical protein PKD26_07435 [Pyrinomonadaceae bacterium]|nr:hypothetical protein [Pyrinomonadaceae bacterium]
MSIALHHRPIGADLCFLANAFDRPDPFKFHPFPLIQLLDRNRDAYVSSFTVNEVYAIFVYMKFNRNQAKALTNAKELELYDMARPPKLSKLSVKELNDLIKRSRTLRDKLRDLKRTQVRAAQAKSKTRGAKPADRSREKAELFGEVHDVFVARLEKVQAGEARSKAKPATKKPTKTDKNIKTRADRTGVRQKLKAVKKAARTPAAAEKTGGKKKAVPKTSPGVKTKAPLASAARVSKAAPTKNRAATRSAKATFASKAAVNPERTVTETPQSAARKPDPVGKVEHERISRSGIARQRGHLSSLNKRNQGKRDSK